MGHFQLNDGFLQQARGLYKQCTHSNCKCSENKTENPFQEDFSSSSSLPSFKCLNGIHCISGDKAGCFGCDVHRTSSRDGYREEDIPACHGKLMCMDCAFYSAVRTDFKACLCHACLETRGNLRFISKADFLWKMDHLRRNPEAIRSIFYTSYVFHALEIMSSMDLSTEETELGFLASSVIDKATMPTNSKGEEIFWMDNPSTSHLLHLLSDEEKSEYCWPLVKQFAPKHVEFLCTKMERPPGCVFLETNRFSNEFLPVTLLHVPNPLGAKAILLLHLLEGKIFPTSATEKTTTKPQQPQQVSATQKPSSFADALLLTLSKRQLKKSPVESVEPELIATQSTYASALFPTSSSETTRITGIGEIQQPNLGEQDPVFLPEIEEEARERRMLADDFSRRLFTEACSKQIYDGMTINYDGITCHLFYASHPNNFWVVSIEDELGNPVYYKLDKEGKGIEINPVLDIVEPFSPMEIEGDKSSSDEDLVLQICDALDGMF